MRTKMILDRLLQTHHVATSAKIIWQLSKTESSIDNIVYIRNLFFGQIFPISDFATGPFTFTETNEGGELSGIDLQTREIAFLRIKKDGVVEIKNREHLTWFCPAMGGIRMYVPF